MHGPKTPLQLLLLAALAIGPQAACDHDMVPDNVSIMSLCQPGV